MPNYPYEYAYMRETELQEEIARLSRELKEFQRYLGPVNYTNASGNLAYDNLYGGWAGYPSKATVDALVKGYTNSPSVTPKETPVNVTTTTVSKTVKKIGSIELEVHTDGTFTLKGFHDDAGKYTSLRFGGKESLKAVFRLLSEVLLEGK